MSGYRLREDELAAIADEPADESADEPADELTDKPGDEPADEAPGDPAGAPGHELVGPSPRDLAYTVRLFDPALLRIDASQTVDDDLSLAELLATRDRALDR